MKFIITLKKKKRLCFRSNFSFFFFKKEENHPSIPKLLGRKIIEIENIFIFYRKNQEKNINNLFLIIVFENSFLT